MRTEEQINRLEELQKRLEAIPLAIETQLQNRRVQEQNMSDKESDMHAIEIKIRQQITEENVDGKRVYSNQQQRDDETAKRLNYDFDYKRLRTEFSEAARITKEILDTIEILKYKLRVAEKVVDIELSMGE